MLLIPNPPCLRALMCRESCGWAWLGLANARCLRDFYQGEVTDHFVFLLELIKILKCVALVLMFEEEWGGGGKRGGGEGKGDRGRGEELNGSVVPCYLYIYFVSPSRVFASRACILPVTIPVWVSFYSSKHLACGRYDKVLLDLLYPWGNMV